MEENHEAKAVLKSLIGDRNREMDEVRERYNGRIKLAREEFRRLAKEKRKRAHRVGGRFLEDNDAPERRCIGCGEVLLRATEENGERMVKYINKLIVDYPMKLTWGVIRRMRESFCCHCCRDFTKENRHSLSCSSAVQMAEREQKVEEGVEPCKK